MKTNLPESRNRNLPGPPAAAAPIRPRMPMMPPDQEPRRGPSMLRSVSILILMVGLVGTGIWYYIRGIEGHVRQEERIAAALESIGREVWALGSSTALTADTDETKRELEDLPRIIGGIKAKLGKAALSEPECKAVDGDTPGGRGRATHHLTLFMGGQRILIIRVVFDESNGRFLFISEANPLVPSLRDLETQKGALPPGAPGTGTKPVPVPTPAPASAPVPGAEKPAAPPPSPAPAPAETKKVSEQP